MTPASAAPTRSPTGETPRPRSEDLVDRLVDFLRGSTPRLLLIKGGPGSGKSTLVRSLLRRLSGPRVLLAYRSTGASPGVAGRSPDPVGFSLMLVEPALGTGGEAPGLAAMPSVLLGGGTAGWSTRELPFAVTKAAGRLQMDGGGFLVVDQWDRGTEAEFRSQASSARPPTFVDASPSLLRDLVGHAPVHTILVWPGETSQEEESQADGVLELSEENWSGPPLRLITLRKMRGGVHLQPQLNFSIDGAKFFAPLRLPLEFSPRVGPPDPDPDPDPGQRGFWPGSQAYARAFGRLAPHGITGVSVPLDLPNLVSEVLVFPMAAHTILSGGHVVAVPTPSLPAGTICSELSRVAPAPVVRERLRILSATGMDPRHAEWASVIVSPGRPGDAAAGPSAGVAPLFPGAYDFLAATPAGKPALFLLSFEGLRALSKAAGTTYDASTFPLIVAAYTRLPGFHGFGVSRVREPLQASVTPSTGTRLQIAERNGRLIIYGVQPRTDCFLIDWPERPDRYDFVRMV